MFQSEFFKATSKVRISSLKILTKIVKFLQVLI